MRTLRRLLSVLACAVLIGSINSCVDMGPEPPPPGNILPLAIGNAWVLFRTEYSSTGTVESTVSGSIELTGDTLIDGQRWYYYPGATCNIAYRNTEAGTLVRVLSANPGNKQGLQYKQPCSRGDSYPYAWLKLSETGNWVNVDSIFTCVVRSVDTLITVPAGTFHCIQYHVLEIDDQYSFDDFLAPGAGWIKRIEYFSPSPGGRPYIVSVTETRLLELH